jgi:hypothetical protein
MEIKLTHEEVTYLNKVKEYEIKLPNGTILKFRKSWMESNYGDYDNDWEWVDNSEELYNKLSDDEQIEVDDFMLELK